MAHLALKYISKTTDKTYLNMFPQAAVLYTKVGKILFWSRLLVVHYGILRNLHFTIPRCLRLGLLF